MAVEHASCLRNDDGWVLRGPPGWVASSREPGAAPEKYARAFTPSRLAGKPWVCPVMDIVIDSANYFAERSVNLGDVAILRTMRDRLQERFPGCAIFCFTASPSVIAEHVPGLVPVTVSDGPFRTMDPKFDHVVRAAVAGADLVVLSGGGFFPTISLSMRARCCRRFTSRRFSAFRRRSCRLVSSRSAMNACWPRPDSCCRHAI
jgi:hypothetical protein